MSVHYDDRPARLPRVRDVSGAAEAAGVRVGDELLEVDTLVLSPADDAGTRRARVGAVLQSPAARVRLVVRRPASTPNDHEVAREPSTSSKVDRELAV